MRRFALALCLVLTIVACGGKEAVAPPRLDTSGMERAVAALIDSRYRALVKAPTSADAWAQYGIALHAHNLVAPAQICYERARELDPTSFAYPYLLSFARDQRGEDIDETLALMEAARAIAPEYPPLYLSMGDMLARAGRYEEARDAFRSALDRDPAYLKAHVNLGEVLLQLGDAESAREHLERAAREEPDDRTLNAALSRALTLTGEPERARELAARTPGLGIMILERDSMFDELEKVDMSSDACFQRAKAYADLEQWEDVVQNLRIVLECRTNDPAVYSRMGQALLHLGRPKEARPHLERTLEMKPEHALARFRLANVHANEGRLDEAKKEVDQVIKEDPEFIDALVLRGVLHIGDKEIGPADQLFHRAARGGRKLGGETHFIWGNALAESGRFREALVQFAVFAELQPGRADARYALGLAYEKNGRVNEAIQEYEVAVGLQPNHPLARRLGVLRKQ